MNVDIEFKEQFARVEAVQERMAYVLEMALETGDAKKAEWAVQVRDNASAYLWLEDANNRWNAFLNSIGERFLLDQKPLTEKQLTGLQNSWKGAMNRKAAKEQQMANVQPLPVQATDFPVIGIVRKAEWKTNRFEGTDLSTTVEITDGPHAGCRVWMRGNKDMRKPGTDLVGCKVVVQLGQMNRSETDNFMGFGKRAKGFQILSQEG